MKQSTRKSQERSTRQKPRQNNFQCTHAHGSRYCHKHMKECDLDCKESGTCAHCTNYHIPMTQCRLTKEQIAARVEKGTIDEAEYEEITGEKYKAETKAK